MNNTPRTRNSTALARDLWLCIFFDEKEGSRRHQHQSTNVFVSFLTRCYYWLGNDKRYVNLELRELNSLLVFVKCLSSAIKRRCPKSRQTTVRSLLTFQRGDTKRTEQTLLSPSMKTRSFFISLFTVVHIAVRPDNSSTEKFSWSLQWKMRPIISRFCFKLDLKIETAINSKGWKSVFDLFQNDIVGLGWVRWSRCATVRKLQKSTFMTQIKHSINSLSRRETEFRLSCNQLPWQLQNENISG